MLQSLYIRNFLLIDELTISFEDGLSVITGETGAGKSIILGALSLVLGQRSDTKSLREVTEKCIIEAEFDISDYHLASFFQMHELDYDKQNCILRRELLPSGKTRGFINDTPVALSLLKEIGAYLIDVHSQHQNLLLSESRFQLGIVDAMAGNSDLLVAYKQTYANYQSLKEELALLEEKIEQASRDEDYIKFQFEQLKEANLKADEQTELESELETLSHAEEIKTTLYKVHELLAGEGAGGLSLIYEARASMNDIDKYLPRGKEFAERLQTAYLDLKDLTDETGRLVEDIAFNPSRLEWIQERLDQLYSLQQKHRVSTVEELLALIEEYEIKLSALESYDEELDALKERVSSTYDLLERQAEAISQKRQAITKRIVTYLDTKLALLGMPHAHLEIAFTRLEHPGKDGRDDVEFLFTANKNEALKPVSQVASGGEISRLMICLKAMVAGSTSLPSIIFDEIDTGVSGDIADKMGEVMTEMGSSMQVIAITHLPQIAAKGDAHWFVYKDDSSDRTYTRIRLLSEKERMNELARMLSGSELTEEALANAKVLLETNSKKQR